MNVSLDEFDGRQEQEVPRTFPPPRRHPKRNAAPGELLRDVAADEAGTANNKDVAWIHGASGEYNRNPVFYALKRPPRTPKQVDSRPIHGGFRAGFAPNVAQNYGNSSLNFSPGTRGPTLPSRAFTDCGSPLIRLAYQAALLITFLTYSRVSLNGMVSA